jgi:hypothetical protein
MIGYYWTNVAINVVISSITGTILVLHIYYPNDDDDEKINTLVVNSMLPFRIDRFYFTISICITKIIQTYTSTYIYTHTYIYIHTHI